MLHTFISLANSALTPLPQSSKLSHPSGPFDLVIEAVSNILLHVFFLTFSPLGTAYFNQSIILRTPQE